jgi:hypothetical protein
MNTTRRLALLTALTLLPLTSCTTAGFSGVRGSGVATSERRQVPDFRSVHVHGSGRLTARAGVETTLSVSCDDNLLPYLVTEVRGETLHIEWDRSVSMRAGLVIDLGTRALDGVSVSGSADVTVLDVDGERLALSISGSGDLRASGRVGVLEARISGSGDMDLLELQAREATVSVSGSGDVDLVASDSLAARISGSGDITYQGSPRLKSVSVSGSGKIHGR